MKHTINKKPKDNDTGTIAIVGSMSQSISEVLKQLQRYGNFHTEEFQDINEFLRSKSGWQSSSLSFILVDLNKAQKWIHLVPKIKETLSIPFLFLAPKNKSLGPKWEGYTILDRKANEAQINQAMSTLSIIYNYLTKLQQIKKSQKEHLEYLIAGAFAAGYIHDTNNIITSLSFGIEKLFRLLNKSEYNNEDELLLQKKSLDNNISLLLKLSNNYKKILRSPTLETKRATPIDFNDLLASIVSILEYKSSRIGCHIDYSIDTSNEITSNEVILFQALLNLVTNSLNALQAANIKEKWIKISVHEDFKMFYIDVVDSGKGIPDEISDLIFTEGFSTHSTTGSTGMGLSFTKELLSKGMNAEIHLLKESLNTTFRIEIPKDSIH